VVEEIITTLSRIRWLFVVARNSGFTYKGRPTESKEIGRDLGVRYLLEGSVRKAAGRVRITAQLIEAETASHLWADHFDGALRDVFDLQTQVAISVAGVIEPTLQAAETARSFNRSTADSAAYDLYLRASAVFLGPVGPQRAAEAAGLLFVVPPADGRVASESVRNGFVAGTRTTRRFPPTPPAARRGGRAHTAAGTGDPARRA